MSKNEKNTAFTIITTNYNRGNKQEDEQSFKDFESYLKSMLCHDGPREPDMPCVRCGEMPTKEGYDACLGSLPGVFAACCGHGVEEGYILFENGVKITGNFEIYPGEKEAKQKILAFLEDFHGDINPFSLVEELNINYAQVKYNLKELVDDGFLIEDNNGYFRFKEEVRLKKYGI